VRIVLGCPAGDAKQPRRVAGNTKARGDQRHGPSRNAQTNQTREKRRRAATNEASPPPNRIATDGSGTGSAPSTIWSEKTWSSTSKAMTRKSGVARNGKDAKVSTPPGFSAACEKVSSVVPLGNSISR
jgi:hypothetical protein